jgi:hypothetical protein
MDPINENMVSNKIEKNMFKCGKIDEPSFWILTSDKNVILKQKLSNQTLEESKTENDKIPKKLSLNLDDSINKDTNQKSPKKSPKKISLKLSDEQGRKSHSPRKSSMGSPKKSSKESFKSISSEESSKSTSSKESFKSISLEESSKSTSKESSIGFIENLHEQTEGSSKNHSLGESSTGSTEKLFQQTASNSLDDSPRSRSSLLRDSYNKTRYRQTRSLSPINKSENIPIQRSRRSLSQVRTDKWIKPNLLNDKKNGLMMYFDNIINQPSEYNSQLTLESQMWIMGNSYSYTLYLIENEYNNYFSKVDHLIFISQYKLNSNAVFVITKTDFMIRGYMMNKFIFVNFEIERDEHISIKKQLKRFFSINYTKFKQISVNDKIINDLKHLEKTRTCMIDKISIGVIYAKNAELYPETIGLIHKTNKKNSSKFNDFMKHMNIPTLYNPDIKQFDDLYHGIQIKYYNSVMMDQQSIRQYIGNCTCMIIFKEYNEVLQIETLETFGKVNQFFLIVEGILHEFPIGPVRESIRGNKDVFYRISFVRRTLNSFEPFIPSSCVIDKLSIRDFILTKFYNGILELRLNSQMSHLFTTPRNVALIEFANSVN